MTDKENMKYKIGESGTVHTCVNNEKDRGTKRKKDARKIKREGERYKERRKKIVEREEERRTVDKERRARATG